MPDDTTFLQGIQAGAHIVAQGMESRRRLAELRLQEVAQRAQERERAAHVQLLTEQAAKIHSAEQDDAAYKAAAKVAADQFEAAVAEGGDPSHVAVTTMLPLAMKFGKDPAKVFQDATTLYKADRENDPETLKNQLKVLNTQLREQALGIAAGNLGQRELNTELRKTGMAQSAVTTEANLAEKGFAPTITTMPPGTAGPQGVAAGQPLVTPTARPLTSANVTQAQKTLSGAGTTIDQIDRILPLVNEQTVGPAAAVQSVVVDRALANVFPELANKSRIDAQSLFTTLQSSLVKSLRSDSSIAEAERENLANAVPGPREFLTSPARAQAQLNIIQREVARHAVTAAKELKAPLPSSAFRFLTGNDVGELLRSKSITPAQAQAWYDLKKGAR